MSGKYSKKKKKSLWPAVILLVLVIALFAGLWVMASRDQAEMPLPQPQQTEPVESTEATQAAEIQTEPPYTFEEEVEGVTSFHLGEGLDVLRYGRYIGLYMEDGSDVFVENVMMIEVCNTSELAIQYAKITVTGPAGDATFVLTTLLPGQTIVVLEADKKVYSEQDIYTEARLDNLAVFTEEISLHEDKIQIQPLEGGFNITNISGEDITGQICIYFKDVSGDVLYGGITYVTRLDGLAAGEIRQVMSSNFTGENSRIMFVQIVG